MALIKCPECQKSISETAVTCPSCGFALSPEVVAKQKEKQQSSAIILGSGGCLGVLFFVLLCSGKFTGLSSDSSSRPSSSDYTSAQMVTYLDRRDFDTTATAQMQERLSRLSRNYGLLENLIADRLVKTQELLARDSVRMTVQQIADSIEAAAPRTGAISIDELLAVYVTLRSKNSDAQTIAQMRALFDDLGLGTRPPSKNVKRRFDELGIASAEVGIALFGGVLGLFRELNKEEVKRGPSSDTNAPSRPKAGSADRRIDAHRAKIEEDNRVMEANLDCSAKRFRDIARQQFDRDMRDTDGPDRLRSHPFEETLNAKRLDELDSQLERLKQRMRESSYKEIAADWRRLSEEYVNTVPVLSEIRVDLSGQGHEAFSQAAAENRPEKDLVQRPTAGNRNVKTALTEGAHATQSEPEQLQRQAEFDAATAKCYSLFTALVAAAKAQQITKEEFATGIINVSLMQIELNKKTEAYNGQHSLQPVVIDARHTWYKNVDHIVSEVIPRR